MENKHIDRITVPTTIRRKNSDASLHEKDKFPAKSGTHDTHEHMDAGKRSDVPVFMSTHRKSDAEKSHYAESQDKGNTESICYSDYFSHLEFWNILLYLASTEPFVHECKDFAGVTIIFRTAPNQKGYSNIDAYGKNGAHGARRKSEFPHPPPNMQDKFEHGDKFDHTGIIFLLNKSYVI